MALKTFKPYTKSTRGTVIVDKSDLWKGSSYKPLTRGQSHTGGRNNNGRITSRHIGGGSKHKFRVVDFFRKKKNIPATVDRIEYDPNRTAYIALITYKDDEIDGFNRQFIVNYKRIGENGAVTEEFNLTPNIIYDKNEPKIAASNPSTKRYLHRDIFTHVSALPRVELEPEYAKEVEDSLNYKTYEIQTGETINIGGYEVKFVDFNKNPEKKSDNTTANDIVLGATLEIKSKISDSIWTAEPVFIVREDGQFGIPEELANLGLKIKFSDKFPEIVAVIEENLTTKIVQIAQGGTFEMGDYDFTLAGFNQKPQNENYNAQEGDIAVGARISVFKNDEKITTAEPVMIIRNNQILNAPEELRTQGLRLRFLSINPDTGIANFEVSTGLPVKQTVVLDIAANVNRSDYIVMEAIVFPGINLFWLGSLLMLFGFLQGLIVRLTK